MSRRRDPQPVPAYRVRVTAAPGPPASGTSGFFARCPALLAHARRAMREAPSGVRYYWRAGDGTTLHVTIEVSGAAAVLEAAPGDLPWQLTVREHEVLTCMAGGMTNPEIAAHLGCARRTVATHAERVLAKLAVPSRAAAAALAVAQDALLAPLPPAVALAMTPVGRVTAPLAGDLPAPRSAPPPPARKRAIRLGAAYPLHGPRRLDGLAMRRGAAMAIDEINARGGIGGRRVEHVVAEFAGDDDALAAVEQLSELEVDAMTIGTINPVHSLDAIRLAAGYGAPLLHAMVAPAITEHVHDNPRVLGQTFQVCAVETAYVAGFVRALDLLCDSGRWRPPNRRLAVMVRRPTSDPAQLAVLAQLAESRGWRIELVVPIDDAGVDWPDVVARLRRSDPAAVFVCTYIEDELRKFLHQIHASGPAPLLYTVWTPSIPGFAERMGPLAEGLLWSTVIGTYADPISGPFRHRYQQAFGADPGTGSAAIHYDMVQLLAGAWSALDRPWDFGGVVKSLRQTVHRGVAGPYYFGGKGQRALAYPDDTPDASLAHAHLVHRISQSRSRLIAPFEVA